MKTAFDYAFPRTIPVFVGYIFLGMAYGILMAKNGYGFFWTLAVSLFVYAGSLQYLGVTMLVSLVDPFTALIMSLVLNARHLFYGISMLERYRAVKRFKPYLIFGLTDETFSVVCHAKIPESVDQGWAYFWLTALDHGYWVLGSVLGVVAGSILTFNTTGLDFALTALFAVIFVDQWKQKAGHAYALIGVAASIFSIILCGAGNFIIYAMLLIILILTLQHKKVSYAGTMAAAAVFCAVIWGCSRLVIPMLAQASSGLLIRPLQLSSELNRILIVAAMMLGTLVTRFLPFLLFPAGRETPPFISFLSNSLPFASIGLLVVYCLKDVNLLAGSHGIPQLLAITLIAVLHRRFNNSLLSIGAGTAAYMLLVQTVFS